MTMPNWLVHVQDCWCRDLPYKQYVELGKHYHPQFHVASEPVYQMLCGALQQDMAENIGRKTPSTKEEDHG